MQFTHTDEQRELRRELRSFARERIEPQATALDREGRYPAEILAALGERRLTGMTLPEIYGGRDDGLLELAIVIEELSAAAMPVASALALHLGVATEIEHLGSAELREAYLPAMARFETVGALGLTEANAGSDTMAMETTARRDGDDWVLSGSKSWVTNYLEADVVLTYAKTGPEADTPRNVGAFLVPAERFEVETVWETLGARSVKTVAVRLDDVRVSDDRMVGEEGTAYVRRGEGGIGVNLPARAVGIARAALEDTIAFVSEEAADALGDSQAIRHRIADMSGQVEAARLLTLRAADRADRGFDASREISMAKIVATEMGVDVTNEALSIHGQAGYTADHDVGRYVRDARLLPIAGGPNDTKRNALADAVIEG